MNGAIIDFIETNIHHIWQKIKDKLLNLQSMNLILSKLLIIVCQQI